MAGNRSQAYSRPAAVKKPEPNPSGLEGDQAAIDAAYREVLGRPADPDGLANYAFMADDPVALRKDLAMSAEARKKGVNAAKYGAEVVDPGTLTDQDRGFYEVFLKERRGPVYRDELDNWAANGTTGQLTAELRGQIKHGVTEEGQQFSIFTPEAIKSMGGKFDLNGARQGDIALVPEGTEYAGENWDQAGDVITEGPLKGYTTQVATGNQSYGLTGAAVGSVFGEDAGKEVAGRIGQVAGYVNIASGFGVIGLGSLMDEAAAIHGGTEAMGDYNRVRMDTLTGVGVNETTARDFLSNADMVGDVAGYVGAAVLDVITAAKGVPWFSLGYQTLQVAKRASLRQDVDWTREIATAASSIITAGLTPAGAGAATRAGIAAGSTVAVSSISGDSLNESLEAGAWAGATAAAGQYGGVGVSALRATVDDDYSWWSVAADAGQAVGGYMLSRGGAPAGMTKTQELAYNRRQQSQNWGIAGEIVADRGSGMTYSQIIQNQYKVLDQQLLSGVGPGGAKIGLDGSVAGKAKTWATTNRGTQKVWDANAINPKTGVKEGAWRWETNYRNRAPLPTAKVPVTERMVTGSALPNQKIFVNPRSA